MLRDDADGTYSTQMDDNMWDKIMLYCEEKGSFVAGTNFDIEMVRKQVSLSSGKERAPKGTTADDILWKDAGDPELQEFVKHCTNLAPTSQWESQISAGNPGQGTFVGVLNTCYSFLCEFGLQKRFLDFANQEHDTQVRFDKTHGHLFLKNGSMICVQCLSCTAYGKRCFICVNKDRSADAGRKCGCLSMESGCIECGLCRECATGKSCQADDLASRSSRSSDDQARYFVQTPVAASSGADLTEDVLSATGFPLLEVSRNPQKAHQKGAKLGVSRRQPHAGSTAAAALGSTLSTAAARMEASPPGMHRRELNVPPPIAADSPAVKEGRLALGTAAPVLKREKSAPHEDIEIARHLRQKIAKRKPGETIKFWNGQLNSSKSHKAAWYIEEVLCDVCLDKGSAHCVLCKQLESKFETFECCHRETQAWKKTHKGEDVYRRGVSVMFLPAGYLDGFEPEDMTAVLIHKKRVCQGTVHKLVTGWNQRGGEAPLNDVQGLIQTNEFSQVALEKVHLNSVCFVDSNGNELYEDVSVTFKYVELQKKKVQGGHVEPHLIACDVIPELLGKAHVLPVLSDIKRLLLVPQNCSFFSFASLFRKTLFRILWTDTFFLWHQLLRQWLTHQTVFRSRDVIFHQHVIFSGLHRVANTTSLKFSVPLPFDSSFEFFPRSSLIAIFCSPPKCKGSDPDLRLYWGVVVESRVFTSCDLYLVLVENGTDGGVAVAEADSLIEACPPTPPRSLGTERANHYARLPPPPRSVGTKRANFCSWPPNRQLSGVA